MDDAPRPTPTQVLYALVTADITLMVFHVVILGLLPALDGHVIGVATTGPQDLLPRMFNLDGEANLPTWYASAKLGAAAALAWGCRGPIATGSPLRRAFTVLALALLFLSVDETALIHESVNGALRTGGVRAFGNGAWIPAYLGVGVVVAASQARVIVAFLREPTGRALFVTGAVLLVAGAIGVEAVGHATHPTGFAALLEVIVEETLEMVGGSMIVAALLEKRAATLA